MKFKEFKVYEDLRLTMNQYNHLKNQTLTDAAMVDIENAEEIYKTEVGLQRINLVRNISLFPFPVYCINMTELNDGRIKQADNGVITSFDRTDKKLRQTTLNNVNFKQSGGVNIGNNMQKVETPAWIVKDIVSQFESSCNKWNHDEFWVMFNLEFLEELVYERNVKPSRIKFFTDNVIKAKLAKKMYDVEAYVIDIQEFLNNKGNNMPRTNKIIVLGNPPYQTMDGGFGKSGSPIYQKFVETILDAVKPNKLSMITPSRWMLGGKGLDSFRQRMMEDKHIKTIVDDMSCNGVFEDADVAGGVSYFLWDKDYNGDCDFNGTIRPLNEYDIIVREEMSRQILKKVKLLNESTMESIVSVSKPYGFRASVEPLEIGTPCYFKQAIGKKFVDSDIVVDSRNDINKWKILVPKSPIAGQTDFNKPLSLYTNIIIAEPGSVCTETYIVVNSFNSKELADNFVVYLKTKFFRFMVRMRVTSQDVTRECYSFVPDQLNYTRSYDDEYLYKKYNLTEEEIQYIETKIKEI